MDIKILKSLAILALGLTLGASGWVAFQRLRPKAIELGQFGVAPDFKLTDQTGHGFDSTQLRGKVWVASFVYTSCKDSCPMLAAQMKRLSQSMPGSTDFRMVSISVDPEKDTPQRLAEYAKDLGAEDPRWSFLTGKKNVIRALVVKGFMLATRSASKENADILHSSKLVLVDKRGDIRGYFDGLLSESAGQNPVQRHPVAGGALRKIKIAISLGDPAGIGPEVTSKALADPRSGAMRISRSSA